MTADNPENSNAGIVYALANESMPDLVKIGCTDRENVQARMKELFSTGVPCPFECIEAVRVDDFKKVERLLHRVFEPNRYYAKREFFEVSVEQVQALFSLLDGADAKPDVQKGIEDATAPSLTDRKRRPRTYLSELGIPDNADLKFVGRTRDSDSVTAVVVNAASNRLRLKENDTPTSDTSTEDDYSEDFSFSRLTAILLDGKAKNVPGWDYWEYEGELLSGWRDEALE